MSLVVLAICIRRKRWAYPALAIALSGFAVLCWQPWPPQFKPKFLEVTAIDVSQGDSLLVVFPDGETMLVDAGGFPGMERMARKPQIDIGEDVVSPYLWSRRIHRLDYAVLTHGHSDHMAGLPGHSRQLPPAGALDWGRAGIRIMEECPGACVRGSRLHFGFES